MTRPLLVRGSLLANPWFVVPLLLAAGALAGLVAHSGPGPAALPVWLAVGIPAVPASVALVAAVATLRNRRWLEVTLTGFILQDRHGRRRMSDAHVARFREGWKVRERSVRRRIGLEFEHEAPERIEFDYPVPAGQPDPLAAFWERIIRGIVERGRQALPRGCRLRGDSWELGNGALRVKRGRQSLEVPLDQLSCSAHCDGCLCLWRGSEEAPFLRIPASSWNAGPLARLVGEILSGRPPAAPLPGLGRLFFERQSPEWGLGLALLLVGVPLFLLFLVLGIQAEMQGYEYGPGEFLVAVVFLPFVLLGIVCFRRGRRSNLRCHERGVAQVRGGRLRCLAYDEIGGLTGGPVEFPARMAFRPRPGLERPTITFSTVANRGDADLKSLFDAVAGMLAEGWAGRLSQGEPVPWTPRLRFLPGGLECSPGGRQAPEVIPYAQTAWRLEGGYFLLFVHGRPRPILKERTTHPDFPVGLVLLNRIYAAQARQPGPAPETPRAPVAAVNPLPPSTHITTVPDRPGGITEGPPPG